MATSKGGAGVCSFDAKTRQETYVVAGETHSSPPGRRTNRLFSCATRWQLVDRSGDARSLKPCELMTDLHPKIASELRDIHVRLTGDGTLPPRVKVQSYYDAFRRNFGPEVLRSLDGQELLERMHAHGNRHSMVYWLEFKDDEEFPALFGSISGGSALKFGVYRRAETGTWATKGSGPAPKDISVEEAIAIARRHRDQLLAAVEVVAAMPNGRADEDYRKLQVRLQQTSPDVENTAWGHKYLSLIFPEVLDDFHVVTFQRYHLIRSLQVPPEQSDGGKKERYISAGRYVGLAQQLGVTVHELATLLNRRNGDPKTYWRIGTTDDEHSRRKYWPLMRNGNLIAVGWQKIGDLSSYAADQEGKNAFTALVAQHYPGVAQRVSRSAGELFSFVTKMAEGDRVIVSDGQTVLGIAEVAGPYRYDGAAGFPHQRPVIWRSLDEWQMTEGLRTSVFRLKDPANRVAIERHIVEEDANLHQRPPIPAPEPRRVGEPPPPPAHRPLSRLPGVGGQLQMILERKGQAIVYGPPGTGKTFWALRTARELASQRAFGVGVDQLADVQRASLAVEGSDAPLVRMTSFHPEYGYEDFIEGYRPSVTATGSLSFTLVPGVFRRVCADAVRAPHLDFYLIIDEINRGDVPRIFGELLTLLEHDKRGEVITLPVSGQPFRVPQNVYIIGTMNTADRSIALLDVALRRRFGFVELMPDYDQLKNAMVGGLPLGPWLRDINNRIRASGGGDARNRQVGHAFLLASGAPITTLDQLAAVLRDDLLPLLEEYCYDDFTQVADIVGDKLVDVSAQRVRRELLQPGRGADLVAALLRPEIVTAAGAVLAEAAEGDDDETDSGLTDSASS